MLPLLLALAFLASLGRFDDDIARRDFIRDHPDAVIEEIGVGEGDASAAYVHIRHHRRGEAGSSEDVWLYILDDRTGRWQRATPLSASSH